MPGETSDQRPGVAIGHVGLEVSDIGVSAEYFIGLGMREVTVREDFAVLELRGGTHLFLSKAGGPVAPGPEVPFDLMVDDIGAAREAFEAKGLSPSGIDKGHIHNEFTITGPDGCVITITSSHTSGRVV
jgi:hypothetical protein